MILLLNIPNQLPKLLLLLGVELVGLGAEEFSFKLGDERLGLGQLLSLLAKFVLGLGEVPLRGGKLLAGLTQLLLERRDIFHQPLRMLRRLPQQFFPALHAQRASRKLRRSG